MNQDAIRYRARRLVLEELDDGAAWAGAVPSGPLVHLNGIGHLVVRIVEDAPLPLTAEAVAAGMRDLIEGMPDDAAQVVAESLEGMAELGLVERLGPARRGARPEDAA